MPTVHPKAGAAALFAAGGGLIVAILTAAGVDVSTGLGAAITGFSGALGAYLAPSSDQVTVTPPPVPPPVQQAQAASQQPDLPAAPPTSPAVPVDPNP